MLNYQRVYIYIYIPWVSRDIPRSNDLAKRCALPCWALPGRDLRGRRATLGDRLPRSGDHDILPSGND